MFVILVPQLANAQVGRVYFGSQQPQITTFGNNMSITWQYWNPELVINQVTSNDDGTTLSGKIILMKNNTVLFPSNVRDSKNDIYYAWWNYSIPFTPRLFLTKSSDNGIIIGNPVLVVSHDNHPNESVELENLFASGKNVYAIWSTYREVGSTDFGTIFLSKSMDDGETFDSPIAINAPDTSWYGLETVTSENKTYFMWQSLVPQSCILGQCKSQIHTRSMDDNGTMNEISNTTIQGNISQAKIAASGNDVYITGVIFEPNSTSTMTSGLKTYLPSISSQWVFFSKSSDGGNTFGEMKNLSGSSFYCIPSNLNYQCNLGSANSYISGDHVYTIWDESDYADNTIKAFLVTSTDNGSTFGKILQLEPYGFDDMMCPTLDQCISVQLPPESPNAVYLTWATTNFKWTSAGHIIFAKSTDGGKTLDYLDVTNSTGIELSPVVALGPNNVVYLAGLRPGFEEGNHALFSKSNDGGNSFSNATDLDMLQEASVPEFPMTSIILVVSIASMIVFHRSRF